MRISIHHFIQVIALCLTFVALPSLAQESEERLDIHLKKIRDIENNYLRAITKATVAELSATGQYSIKPHKRGVRGTVMELEPVEYKFTPVKDDGASATDIASAGLSIAADIGGLFGKREEASVARQANSGIQRNKRVFDNWGDNEEMDVVMTSRISVFDRQENIYVTRTIEFEERFDSKKDFLNRKDEVSKNAIVQATKLALEEYIIGDDEF